MDQPRFFTLFDLVWELMGVAFVSAGCYVAWTIRSDFLAMLVGGIVGRIVFVAAMLSLRGLANRRRS